MADGFVTICTLEGEPLNKIKGFRWGLSEGVSPFREDIIVTIAQASKLLGIARQRANSPNPYLTLVINGQNGNNREVITFKNVLITGYSPSPTEPLNFVTLHLADNRFFWTYGYFDAHFNIRTRVGDKESVSQIEDPTVGSVPTSVFDQWSYRTFSLNPPIRDANGTTKQTTWKISEIVREILIGSWPQSLKSQYPNFNVQMTENSAPLKATDSQLFEEIRLSGNHATVLRDILDRVPHIGIYVDYDGIVRFYDKSSGNESSIIAQLNAPMTTGSVPRFVRNDLVCPREIHVLFDTECEVRFDFEEVAPGGTETVQHEGRSLINVMPCPDYSLPVTTSLTGADVPHDFTAYIGQYLPFDAALEGLRSKYNYIPFDKTSIQRSYMFPGFIEQIKYKGIVRDPGAPWDAIIGAIKENYRTLFRINGNWASKMINIKPKRCSIFDPTSGETAPSLVYQDYAVWYATKSVFTHNPDYMQVLQNVIAWKTAGSPPYSITEGTTTDTQAKAAIYATINMIDADNGIFKIDLKGFDPTGFIKKIYPSKLENMPIWNYSDKTKPHFVDEKPGGVVEGVPQLSTTHRMATILSASPAQNVASVFYKVKITPKDLKPGTLDQGKLLNPSGPIKYIKASAKNGTARIAWRDTTDIVDAITRLFGVGNATPEFDPILEKRMVNVAFLKEFANALALAEYSKYVDRYKGSMVSQIKKVLPIGAIHEIVHQVEQTGAATTGFEFMHDISVPTYENLLKPETKSFLYGQVKDKA